MERRIGVGASTAARIRAAMFGTSVEGIQVVRQAWRVSDVDSDELALLCVNGSSWWCARRISADLSVWAYPGDDEAAAGFERLMSGGPECWTESAAAPATAPVAG